MTFFELITDPIIQAGTLAAVGAFVSRVALRNNPRLHLIFQVTFFIVLTTLLLYHGIVPYEAGPPTASAVQKVFIGIAKVIWWINAAWALVGFARVFLISKGVRGRAGLSRIWSSASSIWERCSQSLPMSSACRWVH
jgi:hypothetical protein